MYKGPNVANGGGSTAEPGAAIVPSQPRRWVVRTMVYATLLVVGGLAAVEMWAQRSYQSTVSKLGVLQDGAQGDIPLSDAMEVVGGWTTVETKERSMRDDVTIVWKSIFGDYSVRLHATKKSKDDEKQIFTGFETSNDNAPKAVFPDDELDPPGDPIIGERVGSGKGRPKKTFSLRKKPLAPEKSPAK